jgi:hypothetical protein
LWQYCSERYGGMLILLEGEIWAEIVKKPLLH